MNLRNKPFIFSVVAIIGVSLFFFGDLLIPGSILFTTDNNVGQNALVQSVLPQAFLGWWNDTILIGAEEFIAVSLTNILMWLIPATFYTNWIHAIYLGSASFFLILYLRDRGLQWSSCFSGILAAF